MIGFMIATQEHRLGFVSALKAIPLYSGPGDDYIPLANKKSLGVVVICQRKGDFVKVSGKSLGAGWLSKEFIEDL